MRLILLTALSLRLPSSCLATLFPRSIYDSCVDSRNANFTHALEPVPGVDTSAFFTMTNLEDATSCLGRVPHPVNPSAFEALGWVNCSAADKVVQVRYNSTTVPSSTLYTRLRFTVTAIRGPLAKALGTYYSIFGFAFYDPEGNSVKIESATITPNVPGDAGDASNAGWTPLPSTTPCGANLANQVISGSQATCAAQCAARSDCGMFDYNTWAFACWLKSAPPQTDGGGDIQCFAPAAVVDLTSMLTVPGARIPVENFYGTPIDFVLASPSMLGGYSFTTNPTQPTQDPVAWALSYSPDNGATWVSLATESNANLVTMVRNVTAGPFELSPPGTLVPPPLPDQVFSTGKVGVMVNSAARSEPTAYRYYSFTPLSSQGCDIARDSSSPWAPRCTCMGAVNHFCVSISELSFFYQGVEQLPVNAVVTQVGLVESNPVLNPYGRDNLALFMIDGDVTSYVTLALAASSALVHSTPFLQSGAPYLSYIYSKPRRSRTSRRRKRGRRHGRLRARGLVSRRRWLASVLQSRGLGCARVRRPSDVDRAARRCKQRGFGFCAAACGCWLLR